MRSKLFMKRVIAVTMAAIFSVTLLPGNLNLTEVFAKTVGDFKDGKPFKEGASGESEFKGIPGSYSSWDSTYNAMAEVDGKYAYRFSGKDDATQSVIGSAKKLSDSTSLPKSATYDDGTKTWTFEGQGTVGEQKNYTWFSTDEIDDGKTVKVKTSGLTIRQLDPASKAVVKHDVDVVCEVLDYEESEDWVYHNNGPTGPEVGTPATKGYIGIGKDIFDLKYCHCDQVRVKYTFYEAGTNTPIRLDTNVTLSDIDRHQFVGINAGNVEHFYADKDTTLYHRVGTTDKNFHYFYDSKFLSAEKDDAKYAVGFTIEQQSSAIYRFGKLDDEEGGHSIAPNQTIQYVGYGQTMMRFKEPSPPTKEVEDRNEDKGSSNKIEDLKEDQTYTITQQIPSNLAENGYYKSFEMYDQIDTCFKIKSVKMFYGQSSTAASHDVTDWFTITTTGNKVDAKLKDPKADAFYGHEAYRMVVKTEINTDGVDLSDDAQYDAFFAKLKAHGHVTNTGKYTFDNKPVSVIDGEDYPGNVTTTDMTPPKKTVSDDDETNVTHNTVRDLGKSWTYKIATAFPKGAVDGRYNKFALLDDIESCMKILDVKVKGQVGSGAETDVTNLFTVTTANNKVVATLKDPSADAMYNYDTVNLYVKVKVNTDGVTTYAQNEALIAKLKAHGHFNSTQTIITEYDKARVQYDEDIVWTNKVQTDVGLTTYPPEANKPGIAVTKSVDPYEYQVNDKITYTVTAKNTNTKADIAYFTIVDDTLPDTMKLDPTSIKVEGIETGKYTLTTNGNAWTIKSVGDYALPQANTIKVTYTAQALVPSNGTVVNNTVTAWATGVPKQTATQEVYINSPKIDVVKTHPDKQYKVGDTPSFNVTVTNRNPGTFMRNLYFTDTIEEDGVTIVPGTVAVMLNGKDVTNDLNITYSDDSKSFKIVTPYNMKNGVLPMLSTEIGKTKYDYLDISYIDKLVITYQASINEDLSGQVIHNTFVSPATENSNGDLIRDDETIPSGGGEDTDELKLKSPSIQIEKTSDKSEYVQGSTGHYTLKVTQNKEDLVAKDVTVWDAFENTDGYVEAGMKILPETLKVKYNGSDITKDCKITMNEDNLGFSIETGKDVSEDDTIIVTYDVNFGTLAADEVSNLSHAKGTNTNEVEDPHTIRIPHGDPVLKIVKTSNKEVYTVGDTGLYTLNVSQTDPKAIAENVTITDHSDVTGIVASDVEVFYNGSNITKNCKIKISNDTTGMNISIATGKNMSVSDKIKVTYKMLFKEPSSMTVLNTAIADADNTDPVEDPNTVKLLNPVLNIVKTSDKKTYTVGDTGKYTLTVTQKTTDAIAKQVVITDTTDVTGVKVSGVKVTFNGSDITKSCKVTMKDDKLSKIETFKDMTVSDKIVVTYNMLFKEPSKLTVLNTAKAKGTNTTEVEDPNTVKLLLDYKLTKDSDKKSYNVGDYVGYTIKVALKQKGTAKNVQIIDTLPTELKLSKDTVKVEGVKNAVVKVSGQKLIVTIPKISYKETATITYKALALKAGDGVKNVVKVTGKNIIPKKTNNKIKINGPTPKSKNPSSPSNPGDSDNTGVAKTSDMFKMGGFLLLGGVALIGIVYSLKKKRKSKVIK